MSKNIATVDAQTTVAEAARIMSSRNISCVVVLHRNELAGILTEKDVLKRVVALSKNATQTRVPAVMSCPVASMPPSCSILSASKMMEKMHIHRLVIMDGKEVCGIVTQTDVMRAVRSELERREHERLGLTAQLDDLPR
jgi:CBS domain-containing protein